MLWKENFGGKVQMIESLRYALEQAIKNIKRNRLFSLASVGTISACLFLFGIFYFVVSNVQYVVKNAETSVAVSVFFDEGIKEEQITIIGEKIKTRDEVDHIDYISADQAWETFKEQKLKGQEELIETFGGDNPLADSASYEVYLKDVSKQDSLVKYIQGIDGVRQVNSSVATAKGLSSVSVLVGTVSAVIIILLLVVSVFLISNTVAMGISRRKEEIFIMHLVGATDFFIEAPFLIEGVTIGLAGACFPIIVLSLIYHQVVRNMEKSFEIFAMSDTFRFLGIGQVLGVLIPTALIIGIGIGFLGSYIIVRKQLRIDGK